MSQHEVETIELSIQEAKKHIDLMRALERLTKNRDFKKLILDGYFEKEAVRLVHAKAAPSMDDVASQKAIEEGIAAIGYFRQYLFKVRQMGKVMEKEVLMHEEALEEIHAEEVEVTGELH